MVQTLIILGRNGKAMAAADAAPVPLGARDPFGKSRHVAFSDTEGFAAGHVRWDGETLVDGLPHAEVVVLTAGAVNITQGSAETIVRPGEAVVLPRGLKATLAAGSGTVWFFCAMSDGVSEGEDPPPIRLDPLAERAPSPGPAPEVRIGPPPQCRSLNLFTDRSGMRAGVWEAVTPCARRVVPHRVNEMMHILEGSVELTHQEGATQRFAAGDTLLIPRGAPYAWRNEVPVIKYYCVR